MAQNGAKLEIDQAILKKLGAEHSGLWAAAHDDGSGNRINPEEILDASTVHASLGVVAAIVEGLKKAFRNRGKTKDDLAAEKEGARINTTCGAVDLLMRDYLRAAQTGSVSEDDLDSLIDNLELMEGYQQEGKLTVSTKELNAIAQSIADYTAALTGSKGAEAPGAKPFRLIREQLIRQKEWMGKQGLSIDTIKLKEE